MRRGRGAKPIRVLSWLAASAVIALALAQLFLPGLAASRIRSRVGRYGTVASVRVSAWPALRLLWGSASSVRVAARALRLTPAQSAQLLWEARHAASVEVTATSVIEDALRMTAARLRKRGSQLFAEAHVSPADAKAALPAGLRLQLLESRDGEVRVSVGGSLFGLRASVEALAGASGGALVARPAGPLALTGAHLTLFADPRVYVEGVGAREAVGGGYELTMSARLR